MEIPYWRIIAFSFVLIVTVGAMWKGGRPEKLAGLVMLGAVTLSSVSSDYRWLNVQYKILLIDTVMMAFLVFLALRADRWWPLFGAGFEGMGLLIHLAFAAQHKVMSIVYVTALNLIGYMVIATLAAGTLAHMARRRRARKEVDRTTA